MGFLSKEEQKRRIESKLGFGIETDLSPEDFSTAEAFAEAVAKRAALKESSAYRHALQIYSQHEAEKREKERLEKNDARMDELKMDIRANLSDLDRKTIAENASRALNDAITAGTVPRSNMTAAAAKFQKQAEDNFVASKATSRLFSEQLRAEVRQNTVQGDIETDSYY